MKFKRIRGGTWNLEDWRARCACRHRCAPDYRGSHVTIDAPNNVGFRCCFSPFFVKINKERLEK